MVRHRLLLPTIVLALISLLTGCQSAQIAHYPAADVASYTDKRISAIILKNGEKQAFTATGAQLIESRSDSITARKIVGNIDKYHSIEVDLDRVLEVECNSTATDPVGSFLGITLLSVGLALLAIVLIFSNTRWN